MRAVLIAIAMLSVASHWAVANTISGQVIDAGTQQPLGQVTMNLRKLVGPLGMTELIATTLTDVNGNYMFEGRFQGNHYVDAIADGYLFESKFFSVPSGGNVTNLNFILSQPAGFEVTIVDADSGLPLQGILVDARATVGANFGYALTDSNGMAVIGNLRAADFKVCVIDQNDIYQNRCYPEFLVRGFDDSGVAPVSLGSGQNLALTMQLLTGGAIRGRMFDTYSNEPIGNQTVAIELADGDRVGLFSGRVTTNADGDYSIDGLPTGDYFLIAGGPGAGPTDSYWNAMAYPNIPCLMGCFDDLLTPFAVADDAVTANIDFALFPGTVVRGRVVDANTQAPLSGVTVSAREASPNPFGPSGSTLTGADGRFVLAGIPQGTYRLSARNDQGYINQNWPLIDCIDLCNTGQPIGLPADTVTDDIDFHLRTGAVLRGRSFDPLSNEPVDAVWDLRDAAGNYITQNGVDAAGNLLSPALPDGQYYAVAIALVPGERQCQIFADQPCGDGPLFDITVATPIHVAGPTAIPGIDFHFIARVYSDSFESP